MSNSEWLITIIITVAFLSFVFWNSRYSRKKAAEENRLQEHKEIKERSSAFANVFMGGILAGMTLFFWPAIPAGDPAMASVTLGIGLLLILYGVFRFYRLKGRTEK